MHATASMQGSFASVLCKLPLVRSGDIIVFERRYVRLVGMDGNVRWMAQGIPTKDELAEMIAV